MSDLIPEHAQLQHSNQRIALLLEYDGAAYGGSTKQKNARNTVHETLENALMRLGFTPEGLSMAGRTDKGVHGRGQVVHFDVPRDALHNIHDPMLAFNAVLPDTIAVRKVMLDCDPGFHATASARWRWYRYRIYNAQPRSVWCPQDAAWIKYPLDLEAMQAAAQHIVGQHTFTSFRATRAISKRDECNVLVSRLSRDDSGPGDMIVYDIVANRFIYKMVRSIMGTLIAIGAGSPMPSRDMAEILAAEDRAMAGPTAQPQGLSLMAVAYPKPWDFFADDVYVTNLIRMIQESRPDETHLFRKAS